MLDEEEENAALSDKKITSSVYDCTVEDVE